MGNNQTFQISLSDRFRPPYRERTKTTKAIYVGGKCESVCSLTKRWKNTGPQIPGRSVSSQFRSCLLTHSVMGANTLRRAIVTDHIHWRLQTFFLQLLLDDVVPKWVPTGDSHTCLGRLMTTTMQACPGYLGFPVK